VTVGASRLSPAGILVLVGIATGLTVLVLGLGSFAGTLYTLIREASVAVAVIGLVAWLAVALVRPDLRPVSGLMGAFAAALAAFAVSAFASPQVRFAVDFLGYAVLLTALYLLFVRVWRSTAIAQRLEVLLIAACAATGILFVAAMVNLWATMWTAIGRFVVPPLRFGSEGLWTGTPNALAAFQVLLYCGVVTALAGRGRGGRIAAVVLGVFVSVDVALSASRGAWLGVGLATLVTAVAWLLTRDRTALRAAWTRAWTGRNRLIVFGGVVAALGVFAVGVVAVLPRLTDTGGAGLRTTLIAASVRMFQAVPLTGLGPGTWAPNRLAYTKAGEIDYYIPHAHNVPAETLAEFGIVGVVAAVVVVMLLVRLIVTGLRRGTGPERGLALAALFACTYIAGQQLVDAWIHQPAVLFALAIPIARLDAALVDPPAPKSPWRGRLLSAVLLVAVLVGAGAALWPEPAAQLDLEAVAAADRAEWQEAYDDATNAAAVDPLMPPYQLMRGLSAAHLGDLATARDALALAATDDLPATWIDLAAVQARLGNTNGATDSLARGTRLGVQQPAIAIAAAGLYQGLGNRAEAIRMLAAAFSELPSLAADPTWRTADWAPIADGAIADAMAQPDRWQAMLVALEAGRLDDAQTIAAEVPEADRDLARTVVAAWTGDQQAFAALHEAARADPVDETLVSMCRRVASVHDPSGTTPGWACDGGWYFGQYPVATIGDGPVEASLPGADAYWHGSYVYRRPGPIDLLVPWLLHIQTLPA
jgi:O-antigen ligase/tetratricopeptide (TPR) repeat protein